ncbi:MAG TPA: hypothetical protein VF168_09760 [Trueperaceae bacterium]
MASSAGDSEEFLAASSEDPMRWPEGFSYAESSDLELGRDAAHAAQIVGLRFTDLAIPPGAQIERAVVEFTADAANSGAVTVTVRAQDAVETEPFIQDRDGQGSFDLTGRAASAEGQVWSPEAWTAGESYTTPDISGLLQGVVDKDGWEAGGSVVLLFSPSGGDGLRSAHAYDSNPQLAPRLLISLGGGAEGAGPEPAQADERQEPAQADEREQPAQAEDAQEPARPAQPEPATPQEAEEPIQPEQLPPGDAEEARQEAPESEPQPERAREPAEEQAVPEVEVEPVDPDPIIPPAPAYEAPSVWPGPVEGEGQRMAQQPAAEPPREETPSVTLDEPRRARFALVPNFPGGLRGSVLLSDYGGGVTVVTVFLENPDPAVTYAASLRQGACGAAGPRLVDLEPIPGDQAFSTSLLSLGYEELLSSAYNVTIQRATGGFVRIAACGRIGSG